MGITTTWGEAINLVENFKVEKVIFNCGEFNDLELELINLLEKKNIPYYKDIKDVSLKVGIVDNLLNVGDIYIHGTGAIVNNRAVKGNTIMYDIKNPYETFKTIQKIVLDIQTDMNYPNDLRPKENHGYNTEYKG